jgi:hypothetical protein
MAGVTNFQDFLNSNSGGMGFAGRPAPASTQINDSTYDPYKNKWAYTDAGAKQTGYLPMIRASDVQNGKFVGGSEYGQFAADNMGAHGDNYQFATNPDGSIRLGVKTDKTNRLDTTYVKQGDYYVPQAQANNHWDTGSGGFLKNKLKDIAPIASLAALAIPGLQPFALGLNALNAGVNHNYLGALASALPLAGQLGNFGSTFGKVASGLNAANQGVGAVKSFQNGNLLAGLGGLAGAAGGIAGMSGNSDLGGMFGNASKGIGIANNLQKGNYLGALSGGLNMGGYGQAAGALNMANSIYNLTQQRGTQMKQGPVRTVQPMMFGNPTARG